LLFLLNVNSFLIKYGFSIFLFFLILGSIFIAIPKKYDKKFVNLGIYIFFLNFIYFGLFIFIVLIFSFGLIKNLIILPGFIFYFYSLFGMGKIYKNFNKSKTIPILYFSIFLISLSYIGLISLLIENISVLAH